jgi:hypothetical protein
VCDKFAGNCERIDFGRLRLIATITDHAVIKEILGHLGLPAEAPTPMPAQTVGWLPGVETAVDWITA